MSANEKHRKTPWVLLPFLMVWNLATWALRIAGRLVIALSGIIAMALGISLTLTVIGAVVGVPLIVFGFLLMLRSIF